MAASDPLSLTLKALADPSRRAILARLIGGERTVRELSDPLPLSPPAVTKHLKVLLRAGLIEQSRRGVERPVRLRAQPMRQVRQYVEAYRRFWDDTK